MSIPWAIFTTFSATDGNAPATPGLVNPTGTKYSKMVSGKDGLGYTIEVITTGTLTGTFTWWASNKQTPDETSDTDWVDITTDITVSNPAGAPTHWMQSKPQGNEAYHKRLKYVHTSGAGTITAYAAVVRAFPGA